jgi:phosphopantothenoylcysteine decarboxylase/phosphopantothenate--cysteine ligase
MWLNASTQKNVVELIEKNIFLIGPTEGSQACGDIGPGRMMEPVDMIQEISHLLNNKTLKGHHILVTAGPTREPLDPVRYVSNNSSGKMGYAIAQAAIEAGAEVTLVSGPTSLLKPTRTKVISVNTAKEMYKAVMEHAPKCSVFIGAAAVVDYRPLNYSDSKIKKSTSGLSLKLIKSPDIISDVAKIKKRPMVVGFSAETESLLENATIKLKEKKLDMIIANEVGLGKGFEMDHNKVTILKKGGKRIEIPLLHKLTVARNIISVIAEDLNKK